jgi:hypothetical protein
MFVVDLQWKQRSQQSWLLMSSSWFHQPHAEYHRNNAPNQNALQTLPPVSCELGCHIML